MARKATETLELKEACVRAAHEVIADHGVENLSLRDVALDAREHFAEPAADLASLGQAYLSYAAAHPLEYRLMVGTPWPSPAEHPARARDAVHAFDLLRDVLRRMHGRTAAKRKVVDLDAMFIWSTMHGLASVSQANVMDPLELAPGVGAQATSHAMKMLDAGLRAVSCPLPLHHEETADQASFC